MNDNRSAIIFDAKDELEVRMNPISVYELGSDKFKVVPSGEYVTSEEIQISNEMTFNSGYEAMEKFGFSIYFLVEFEIQRGSKSGI